MEPSKLFSKGEALVGIIGFDLGTTNSCVTAYDSEGIPTVLATQSGLTTPSCVQFNTDGSVIIGKEAYRNKSEDNVVYSFKKFMGSQNKIKAGNKEYTAKEVSTIFVREVMDQIYKNYPQFQNNKNIVVSVPAYFDVHQVNDTCQVFIDLGFKVAIVQTEPVSAALVFQSTKRIQETILVFDLGGGTFDAVLIENKLGFPKDSIDFYKQAGYTLPPSQDLLEIIDISGDNMLGGDDIDELAVQLFKEHYKLPHVPDRKLIPIAEAVKVTMSSRIYKEYENGDEYQFTTDFVIEATKRITTKCLTIVQKMLNRAGKSKAHCVLCGGSTKSKYIRDELSKRFNCSWEIDPDLAVGIGNSITARVINQTQGIQVISKVAKYIGIKLEGKFTPIICKGDIIPTRKILYTQNIEPRNPQVSITFYQTEDLFGTLTPVHTLNLEDLKYEQDKDKTLIKIYTTITLDGIISVSAVNATQEVKATLTVVDTTNAGHKEDKWTKRFRGAIAKTGLTELTPLVNEYQQTLDKALAKKINRMLQEWRNING